MPDLTGLPALDVIIGLALMFFVLSTVCSAVNEAIAALLAWRSKNLERAVRNMLGGEEPGVIAKLKRARSGKRAIKRAEKHAKKANQDVKVAVDEAKKEAARTFADITTKVFEHWRIRSLSRRPGADFFKRKPFVGWRGPSYIPPRTFALALEDALFPADAEGDLFTHAKSKIDAIEDGRVKDALTSLVKNAKKDRDEFRKQVESWFDDTMERASGWYKRKVQIMLFAIAIAVAIAANASTINVAHRLWTDDALRQAVVQKADAVATGQSGQTGQTGTGTGGAEGKSDDCKKPAEQGRKATAPTKQSLGCALEGVANAVDGVDALGLPLGWADGNKPKDSYGGVAGDVGGILITIFALSLGAPFWFDVLSKASSLRNSGKKVPTKADVDPAADTPVATLRLEQVTTPQRASGGEPPDDQSGV